MRYTHSFPLARRDIDAGDSSDRKSCPVAPALIRHGYRPSVDEYSTRPFGDDHAATLHNRPAARAWIRDFDHDCPGRSPPGRAG